MADAALDPLDEVNPHTGEAPSQGLAAAGGTAAPQTYSVVKDAADYENVPYGGTYTDPQGNVRQKPLRTIASETEYHAMPEGETYVDPTGNQRKKPVYEPLNFTTQTMHSMAVTDKEKRKVLEKGYPGAEIVDTPDGPLVNDNGTFRKPGKWNSVGSAAGMVGGNAAPIAGGAIGGIVGAGLGGLPAAGGAALGTMGGQYFNDIIMRLNGTYDRSQGEDNADKAIGAASSIAGDAAGRAVAGFVPSIKAGVSNVGKALPDVANKVLGTSAENVTRAREIAELGEKPAEGMFSSIRNAVGHTDTDTPVGVSTFAKEAPHLSNIHEKFNPAFDMSNPLKEGAQTAYEKMAAPLLEKQGVGAIDDLVSPTAAVSTKKAGEKLTAKAMEQTGEIDARFAAELAARRAAAEAGVAEAPAQREAILSIAKERQANATQLVNAGMQEVERNADNAVRAAAQGTNSGDLWQAVGQQIQAVRTALGNRYRETAQAAYQTVPRGANINARPLVREAEDFIANVPAEFRARNPGLIRSIEQLGQRVAEDGSPLPSSVSLEQLHNIRSELRSAADWFDLPSSFKNGSLKYFSHQVDNLMQGVGETPQFQTAIRMLNENDRWFAAERPVFNAKEMKTVLRGLEAGEPADPQQLFKALVRPGSTDLIARTEQVVGPNLWNGVRAAQRQQWLTNARKGQFDNSVDALEFAKEVLDAHRNGTLMAVQGREQGEQLLRQAQQIGMLHGKLDVQFRPNDTSFDVFRQARLAAETAAKQADTDPLKVLTQETRKIAQDVAKQRNDARRADPLRFLSDKSFGATRAVDKILGDEDLILATAHRFGENSAEFNALRQVWTEKLLRGTLKPDLRLKVVSPDVQRLMLGTNLETAQKIAEDMAFITSAKGLQRGDHAGSMAAQALVEHPLAGKAGIVSKASKIIPGANAAGRYYLGSYMSLMSKLMESPATLRWLEKSYTNPEKREAIRQEISKVLQRGGAVGSGMAQGAYQFGNDVDTGTAPTPRRAPDGNYYVPDPKRPGKYLQVVR